MFDFADLDHEMADEETESHHTSPALSVHEQPLPVVAAGEDPPKDHENVHVWWMENRTWPHWYLKSDVWKRALAAISVGMADMMGFTEVADTDDDKPRWTCDCCPTLSNRHFTAFRLVKHIQGHAHLAILLKDKDADQKDEILKVRWQLHQLLEDKNFFREKAGMMEPLADYKPEVIWRAEMQHDHDQIDSLKDGNNFEEHGITRLSDSCFLYSCEHCPDSRITDPSKAFKHMTENKYHANKVYWVNDERKKLMLMRRHPVVARILVGRNRQSRVPSDSLTRTWERNSNPGSTVRRRNRRNRRSKLDSILPILGWKRQRRALPCRQPVIMNRVGQTMCQTGKRVRQKAAHGMGHGRQVDVHCHRGVTIRTRAKAGASTTTPKVAGTRTTAIHGANPIGKETRNLAKPHGIQSLPIHGKVMASRLARTGNIGRHQFLKGWHSLRVQHFQIVLLTFVFLLRAACSYR
jgi:hypothetical protein